MGRSYFVRVGGMFLFFGLIIASFGIRHHSPPAVAFAAVINLIWAWLFWREFRLGPSVLDRDGVTRRDGARFLWTELIAIVDITHKTITSYTSIQFAGGEAPLVAADARQRR